MIEKVPRFVVNRLHKAASWQRVTHVEEQVIELTRKVNQLVDAHNKREASEGAR